MVRTFRDHFVLLRLVLRCIGLSLEEKESFPYRIYSSIAIFCTVTYPLLEIRAIFTYMDDTEMLIDVLMHGSTFVLIAAKTIIIRLNRKQLAHVLQCLGEGHFAPNISRGGDFEEVCISNCSNRIHKLTKSWFTFMTAGILSALIPAVIRRISNKDCQLWELPFGPFSLFNITCTPYYDAIFTYQTLTVANCGYIYLFCDFLYVAIMMHMKTHFLILQKVVGSMTSSQKVLVPKNKPYEVIPLKKLHEPLRNGVIYHQAIMDLSVKVKEIISPQLCSLYVATLLILCFSMYGASMCTSLSFQCGRGMSTLLMISLQLFNMSYWGHQVTLASAAIVEDIIVADTIDTDVRFQKSLVLIILRSQQPIRFSAGGFSYLSINTYVAIHRVAYSYFTVLQGMKQ